ncbi:hypothetical protein LY78DRAFT_653500 [Colletotrichum sublineola]|uniref:Uncharacterized protein n=1 Tax=Colletotrichum sublineola TaxID=1173701 RepID=A0A066X320_COLSU|nr:hypothetical protein LY78DRAFT_653500 [Colletotrichum sublineola]KDN62074.1 hypothetical protein CSUB01_10404 [Colletotrichum sublineola]
MKFTSFPFAVLVASAVAAPLSPTETDLGPTRSRRISLVPNDDVANSASVPPKEGFIPVELLENACLKQCPTISPGIHSYKQFAAFECRLRCAADTYRRIRKPKAEDDRDEDRVEATFRGPAVPQEFVDALLKKHRFWNTTGTESRSEDDMVSQISGGEDNNKTDSGEPMGNPCAWPTEWENSLASRRELYVCLESCPVGSFSGICLHPCFLEITERRCREQAKEIRLED